MRFISYILSILDHGFYKRFENGKKKSIIYYKNDESLNDTINDTNKQGGVYMSEVLQKMIEFIEFNIYDGKETFYYNLCDMEKEEIRKYYKMLHEIESEEELTGRMFQEDYEVGGRKIMSYSYINHIGLDEYEDVEVEMITVTVDYTLDDGIISEINVNTGNNCDLSAFFFRDGMEVTDTDVKDFIIDLYNTSMQDETSDYYKLYDCSYSYIPKIPIHINREANHD